MERGLGFALIATIGFGTTLVMGTLIARMMHPLVFSFLVTGATFAALSIVLAATGKPFETRKLLTVHRKDFLQLLLTRGIVGGVLITFAFSLTIGIRAAFLPLVEPLFVTLVSVVAAKEHISAKKCVLLLALVFGGYLFVTSGAFIFDQLTLGDLLLVAAIAFFSLSYLPTSRLSKKAGPLSVIALMNGLSALFYGVVAVPFFGSLAALSLADYAFLGVFIFLGPLAGVLLWFSSLKTVKPWVTASMMTLQSIVGGLLAFFWLGQTLFGMQLVGALVMLVSVFFIAQENKKR